MNFSEMTKEELIEYINQLSEEKTGKYGLGWDREKIPEKIVTDCNKYIPILEEQKDYDIIKSADNNTNLLIEGDNFHSLSVLNYTNNENVDVIYIDPPYNTGKKDFIYNDSFVDIEDGYRHSKWLNFMEKRLKLSKNLLKENGFITLSIDDNECCQLKLLCDKIFGENNFIGLLPRITKKSGKNQLNTFAKNHDYLLMYAKDITKIEFNKKDVDSSQYKFKDKYYSLRGGYKLNQTLDYETLGYVNSLDYPIKLDGKTYYAGGVSQKEYLERKKKNPKDGYRWRWSKEKLDFGLANDFVVLKKTKNGTRIYTKTYSSASIEKCKNEKEQYYIKYIDRKQPITSLEFIDNNYSNDNAKKNLDSFNLAQKFDYSKPTDLIKQIVNLCKNKNAIVLDFFAGSGTTAQATLELNNEDGGNRKFIICTNNENNICKNITYKRIKSVINGYSKYKPIPSNLKYFKTNFVKNIGTKDQLYYDLTEKCIPMLCVKENTHEVFATNEEYIIYTNRDKSKYTCVYFDIFGVNYDKFIKEIENISEYKSLYIFSLNDYVCLDELMDVKNYSIEPIPYKILELYKKIIEIGNGGI